MWEANKSLLCPPPGRPPFRALPAEKMPEWLRASVAGRVPPAAPAGNATAAPPSPPPGPNQQQQQQQSAQPGGSAPAAVAVPPPPATPRAKAPPAASPPQPPPPPPALGVAPKARAEAPRGAQSISSHRLQISSDGGAGDESSDYGRGGMSSPTAAPAPARRWAMAVSAVSAERTPPPPPPASVAAVASSLGARAQKERLAAVFAARDPLACASGQAPRRSPPPSGVRRVGVCPALARLHARPSRRLTHAHELRATPHPSRLLSAWLRPRGLPWVGAVP